MSNENQSVGAMGLGEFVELREKIKELIKSHVSLVDERKAIGEKLLLRDRQIRELKERCERYERSRKEAYQRISLLLEKLDGVKP